MDKYIVMGFEFSDKDTYEMAKEELTKIGKLKDNNNFSNAVTALKIYNQLVEQEVFKTPVGLEYIRKLQKDLSQNKEIDNKLIKSIKIDKNTEKNLGITSEIISEKPGGRTFAKTSEKTVESNIFQEKSQNKIEKKILENRAKQQAVIYKDRFVKSMIFNVVLTVVVITMFVIAWHSSKFDTLSYKESINNQYVKWEKELNEKESELNERESELNKNESGINE